MSFLIDEDDLLDRVAAMCAQISGVRRVFTDLSELPLSLDDMPCIQLGSGDTTSTLTSHAIAESTHQINGVLIAAQLAGTDTGDLGNESVLIAKPFRARIRHYFLQHPYLSTSALGEYSGFVFPIVSVTVTRPVLYRDVYIAIQFNLALKLEESV